MAVAVKNIATKIANNEKISDYEVIIQDRNQKGVGMMGEVQFFSLVDKNSKKVILDFAYKESLRNPKAREVFPIRQLYYNEIFFYTTLWPELNKLQNKINPSKPLVNVPKYYLSCDEDNNEFLVLGNMKTAGYNMFDKHQTMSKDQYRYVFKQYGKLHGLTFTFKKQNPDSYKKLISQIKPGFDSEVQGFGNNITIACKAIYDFFTEDESDVQKAFEKYRDNGLEIFKESVKYKGDHGILIHGDSWNNNLMFICDENGNFSKMAYIDFQCIRVASPVHDLAYFFYTGASKENLDNLDELLKIYYESLSDILKKCGEKIEEVYPFSVLKEEWKIYSKMGMVFSFLIWKLKTRTQEEMMDVNDMLEGSHNLNIPSSSKYKDAVKNIIFHMHKLGAL